MSGALSLGLGITGIPKVVSGGGAYATGGTVVDISGYKVHIFNSSNTFATTASWPSGRTIEYIVVAGGGGGGDGEAGGGAGGYLTASGVTAALSTNYAVTVGGGGTTGTNGANSSIIGGSISVTSIGGGGGGAIASNGQNGGSGGGGGTNQTGGNGTGGKGVYPGSTYLSQARQGYDGGDAGGKFSGYYAGPGGGAGGVGGSYFAGGGGGAGVTTAILSTTSSSSVSTNGPIFETLNFTIASGLWFQTEQAIYIYRTSDPTKYMWGVITSYSGTTLTCLVYTTFTGTFSNWTVQYAMAGGGGGNSNNTAAITSLGGGGGNYTTYVTDATRDALPNSGGGGSVYQTQLGGSGVVMIKYAYP
jgi:hypothetical protein